MGETVTISRRGFIATVTLRRPEVHNAINSVMVGELAEAFAALGSEPAARVVVLAGEGRSFCAGADVNMMRAAADQSREENLAEAARLLAMFRAIYDCPKPVVGRVHGPAYGGGVGLTACCDLVAAIRSATFSFSEVRLGIVPAAIAPIVVRKIGPGATRRYFLTAERMTAEEARRIGLVSEVADDETGVDALIAGWVELMLKNGPAALATCKRLIEEVAEPDWDRLATLLPERIAGGRASAEGQEGLRAFLERREPGWRTEAEAG